MIYDDEGTHKQTEGAMSIPEKVFEHNKGFDISLEIFQDSRF
jgi:hypothetical protein